MCNISGVMSIFRVYDIEFWLTWPHPHAKYFTFLNGLSVHLSSNHRPPYSLFGLKGPFRSSIRPKHENKCDAQQICCLQRKEESNN